MNLENYDSSFFDNQLRHKQAFAAWRLPGNHNINAVCCNVDDVIECEHINNNVSGFIFAPFICNTNNRILILPDKFEPISTTTSDDYKLGQGCSLAAHCATRQQYVHKIDKTLSMIDADMPKIVLSRCQWFAQSNASIVPQLFSVLCEIQPESFVYQVFIPRAGYWIGASPEMLLSVDDSAAATMAVAGTQPAANVDWTDKERNEQRWVSKFISSILDNNQITYTCSDTHTCLSGNIAHLRTRFSFSLNNSAIGSLLNQLHPTPAVCGLPVDKARQAIAELEGYNRSYYTGYVGFANKQTTNMYVNIRCLQAFSDGLMLYAGGGITAQSLPDSEWQETELKMANLLSIIKKIIR